MVVQIVDGHCRYAAASHTVAIGTAEDAIAVVGKDVAGDPGRDRLRSRLPRSRADGPGTSRRIGDEATSDDEVTGRRGDLGRRRDL